MKIIATTILTIAALTGLVAEKGKLLCCDTTTCGAGSCSAQIDPTPNHGGACIALHGIKSV